MSTIKISQLPSITGANTAGTDLIPLVDVSLKVTNKITRSEFFTNVPPLSVTGNITVTGTVDGRDISVDGTKLDGIEAGAEVNPTAAEIKTLYESNPNTNAFTDAEKSKLAGIEAGADVTDTANVTAAGALMDSELTNIAAVKALNQGVSTTNSPTFAGATVSGDLTIADKIVHSGDTNTSIRFPAADTVTVETSGTERLRIDSAGNAGLGVTPSAWPAGSRAMDIGSIAAFGDVVAGTRAIHNALWNGTNWLYKTTAAASIYTQTVGEHRWSTAPSGTDGTAITFTQAMTLNASGNLGIGTTSPSGTIGAGYTSRLTAYAGSNAAINIKDVNGDWFLGTTGGSLTFYSNTAGTERARIDSAGNVGIGTSSPVAKLDVGVVADPAISMDASASGNFRISGANYSFAIANNDVGTFLYNNGSSRAMVFGVNETERMRIDSSGNVGIASNAPVSLGIGITTLELKGNSASQTDRAGGISFMRYDGNPGMYIYHADDASYISSRSTYPLLLETNGTERARIDASGNLGLGVTPSDWVTGNTSVIEMRRGSVYSSGSGPADHIAIISNAISTGSNDPGLTTWTYKYSGTAELYEQRGGNHRWYTAPSGTAGNPITFTQAMTLNPSGNLGIGTTSPVAKLTVAMDTASLSVGNLSTDVAQIGVSSVSDSIAFGQFVSGGATFDEKARITSAGDLLVAKTAGATNVVGIEARAIGLLAATRDGGVPLLVNRLTSDGSLVEFQQGSITEGTISVSGTTVSYNGGHLSRWAQLPDNSRPELLKGTVMSNLDQMSAWDGEDNEQLNCVQVSDVEGDPNVAGVFVAWDSTDDEYNDILLAMTGDMVIRIAAGTTVQRGDLLMSAGDGTAKPQGDDIVRAKTIAKVTSTHVSHTYEDGSYAVPCVLMAC